MTGNSPYLKGGAWLIKAIPFRKGMDIDFVVSSPFFIALNSPTAMNTRHAIALWQPYLKTHS